MMLGLLGIVPLEVLHSVNTKAQDDGTGDVVPSSYWLGFIRQRDQDPVSEV